MRLTLPLLLVCACGGAPRPAPEPPPPAAGSTYPGSTYPGSTYLPPCRLAPTVRPDGLHELRGRPEEVTGEPCDLGWSATWIEWVREPGHMLVAPYAYDLAGVQEPLGVHDDGGDLVVEVLGGNGFDRHCADEHVEERTLVPTDLAEQEVAAWIALDATDDPIRLEYHYAAGWCDAHRDGDSTIIDLPDPASAAVASITAATDGYDDDEVRYELRGDVLLVTVPYIDDVAPCWGDPGSEPEEPYVNTATTGVIAKRVVVPAVAANVVVRVQHLGSNPPCS